MKKLVALALAGSVALGLVGTSNAGRPATVFQDPAGDAGIEGGSAVGEHAIPGFDQTGFDLVSGEITRVGQNLEFEVTHAAMPPTGSLPEGATFRWLFLVDGEQYRFTIKSQDIGKPDPVSQGGIDRLGQVDIDGHFRLEKCVAEGEVAGVGLSRCTLVAYEDGVFDPASKSFSVSIPLKHIGASTGSAIVGDPQSFWRCPCWIMHTAERTSPPGFILDGTDHELVMYRVPRK